MAEVTDKNANYTPEMLARMTAMYEDLGNEGIPEIAESLGKTVRSVRSKLVREGVYVASPKGVSNKTEGPSKKELLREIEAKGFDATGFEGATKVALSRLLGLVAN
jgi:hypothetical protein